MGVVQAYLRRRDVKLQRVHIALRRGGGQRVQGFLGGGDIQPGFGRGPLQGCDAGPVQRSQLLPGGNRLTLLHHQVSQHARGIEAQRLLVWKHDASVDPDGGDQVVARNGGPSSGFRRVRRCPQRLWW